LRGFLPLTLTEALQAMFALYALLGLAAYHLYRRLPARLDARPKERTPPLRQSRRIVLTLAALFSIDAFGGGLLVQSLLALWFFDRFGLSLAAAGTVFFWSGLLAAVSYLAAARIAERIGLVNTMVFTHLPSNLCLVAMPFAPNLAVAIALFLLRSLLSSMDVPPRAAFVMAVVTPAERPAAASVTLMPRGLAAALGPVLAGAMLAASPFGWPLVVGGVVKSVYDLMLLALFRHHRPPGEGGAAAANESAAP
jgi:predicted MFS family arabinose efflux permease